MSRARLFAATAGVFVALWSSTPAQACSASSSGVAFGQYSPGAAAARDTAGTVVVNCPSTQQNVSVRVSAGNSGSFAQRRMTSGASILNYNLYTTATRTIVLGDGSGGTGIFDLGRTRGSVSRTIYGRIPAGQKVSAGSYSDTLVVTVSF